MTKSDKQESHLPESTAGAGAVTTMLTLVGTLRPKQVPPLFQLIATGEQTGILKVTSTATEVRVDFIGGKIAAAVSLDVDSSGCDSTLVGKLGHLLVRQGKITEQQRDEALIACNGEEGRKFAETLVESGILTPESLRATLREQAKMTLRSLLIFPEGDFDFETCPVEHLQNDGIDLTVDEFLRLARVHDAEWAMIRQLLPSRDLVLEYTEGGRAKCDSARLTMHQQLILSLVDGRRSIRDICHIATMLDYEVYQFLYLMTKANIMRPLQAADSQDTISNQS